MVLSTTIGSSPTMIYFGQEVGEAGKEDAGFGKPTRTSIFDYVGVPNHQRWMNEGNFDGGQLSETEKDLRDFYARLLNFSINSSALMGEFQELQSYNRSHSDNGFAKVENSFGGGKYNEGLYSFVRWSDSQKLIIVNNFSWVTKSEFDLLIPNEVISQWKLKDGTYELKEQLYQKSGTQLIVKDGIGSVKITIEPLESFILSL
jgi:hypothetical protein